MNLTSGSAPPPQFDDCVDFDAAVRDTADAKKFAEGFDSGDHLHPSEKAYQAMAAEALKILV